MLTHYWKLNIVLFALISHPVFGMIAPTESTMTVSNKFDCFNALLPELRPCIIDHVDNMAYIGQTNKECYTIVKDKQKEYIVQMCNNQNPLLARFNIPPFIFSSTLYEFHNEKTNQPQLSTRCAISPHSKIFYEPAIQVKHENNFDNFYTEKIWCDTIILTRGTALLASVFQRNNKEINDLLSKNFFPCLVEQSQEKDTNDKRTKTVLINAIDLSRYMQREATNHTVFCEYEKIAETLIQRWQLFKKEPVKKTVSGEPRKLIRVKRSPKK